MPPRVFLLRHGEAQHNVAPPDPPPDHSQPDPELTSRGITQCSSIPSTYPTFFGSLNADNTVILVSPLKRTMQTLLLGFSSLLPSSTDQPVPLEILPQLQECGAYACDLGGPLEETQARFPFPWLDWSHVESAPEWNQNKGEFQATEEKNIARARWVRRYLRELKCEKVVVVSHHGLLRRIVKAPHAHDRKKSPIQWDNASLREYRFADPAGQDDEADLVRVEDSVL
ncbi:hypothetical protein JCM6882_006000 [Rhodosporidiobolus microsporus]